MGIFSFLVHRIHNRKTLIHQFPLVESVYKKKSFVFIEGGRYVYYSRKKNTHKYFAHYDLLTHCTRSAHNSIIGLFHFNFLDLLALVCILGGGGRLKYKNDVTWNIVVFFFSCGKMASTAYNIFLHVYIIIHISFTSR